VFVEARSAMDYLPPLDLVDARRFVRERVAAELETWVAEVEGAIVGFAALDGNELEHLYVQPRDQDRGVGAALFHQVTTLRPDGLVLWVFQRNEAARRFYERHGCVLVETTDGARNMEREPDAKYIWRPRR